MNGHVITAIISERRRKQSATLTKGTEQMDTEPIIIREGSSTRTERELVIQFTDDAASLLAGNAAKKCLAFGTFLADEADSAYILEDEDAIIFEVEGMVSDAGYVVGWNDGYTIRERNKNV